MPTPNMVTESGRENLSVQDRLALIEQDRLYLEKNWRKLCKTEGGAHRIGQLMNWCRHPAQDLKDGKEVTSETLSKWECELMAWKRGGEGEWEKIRTRHTRIRSFRVEEAAKEAVLAQGLEFGTRMDPEEGELTGWWRGTEYMGFRATDAKFQLYAEDKAAKEFAAAKKIPENDKE